MARKHCESCGGEYHEVQKDGSTYFHVCSPETLVQVIRPFIGDDEVPLAQLAGVELVPDEETYMRRAAELGDPMRVAIDGGRRDVVRRDRRDENTLRREGDRGEIRVMKAEGRGARTIADAGPREADRHVAP